MDELPQLLLRASFGQHAQEGGTRQAVAAALRTRRKGHANGGGTAPGNMHTA